MNLLKRLAKAVLWPLRRLLDPRFDDVNRRVDYSRRELELALAAIDARMADSHGQLRAQLDAYAGAHTDSLAYVSGALRELQHRLAAESDVAVEISRRMVVLADAVAGLSWDRHVDAIVRDGAGAIEPATARLLNWAAGERGPAAEQGLWTRSPLRVAFAPEAVRLECVTDDIVAQPFALRALAALEPGKAVLDVGGAGGLLALQLASLGLRVELLDRRPYPFPHPGLTVTPAGVEHWDAPGEPFAAVTCLHGLGGDGEGQPDAGRRVIERFAQLLEPDGLLVLRRCRTAARPIRCPPAASTMPRSTCCSRDGASSSAW